MADASAGQPPAPTLNPYNPWGSYVNVLTSGIGQHVDKALAPLDKKPQAANPSAGKPPGYAKGVSKVGQTRMGMLKRK
jgi:hypothetical protein